MGLTTSRIPDRVNRDEFRKLLTECSPCPGTAIETDIIFNGICNPEGYVVRDKLLELNLASDVFLSHEWGYDEENRSVHDTVGQINAALQRAGLITWFDEEQEKKYSTGGRFALSGAQAKYNAKEHQRALESAAGALPKTSDGAPVKPAYVAYVPEKKDKNNIVVAKVKNRKEDLNCGLSPKQMRIQAIENTQVCVLQVTSVKLLVIEQFLGKTSGAV